MSALCRREDIPPGHAIECADPSDPDGASLVVLEVNGQIRAYRNLCPHAGRPLNWAPGRFLYAHGQLVCAAHGAAFRPEDGHCIGGPCRGAALTTVAVAVSDGEVRLVG